MTLNDLKPRFQGHDIIRRQILENGTSIDTKIHRTVGGHAWVCELGSVGFLQKNRYDVITAPTKFGRLVQNNMPITVIRSKLKPKVDFSYGGR